MRGSGKRVALCGLLAALGVVILLLGGLLGVGTYISPILAGLLLIPAQGEFGVRYGLLLWLAMGLLSLFIVPDLEETLLFLCFFGWYPALRPRLQRLPKAARWPVKLVLFNAVIAALETLLIFVLIPQSIKPPLAAVLMLLFNGVFICYDFVVPKMEQLYVKRLHPLMK